MAMPPCRLPLTAIDFLMFLTALVKAVWFLDSRAIASGAAAVVGFFISNTAGPID